MRYELHSCGGEYSVPTTTFPGPTIFGMCIHCDYVSYCLFCRTDDIKICYDHNKIFLESTDEPPMECTYVFSDGIIPTDYCIHYDANGTSGMYYCDPAGYMNYMYWTDTVDCNTYPAYYDMIDYIPDLDISDWSCAGSSRYCDKVVYVNINEYSGPEDEIPTFEECKMYATEEPQVRVPMVIDECFAVDFGDGDVGLIIECGDDGNLTVEIGDTMCDVIVYRPDIQESSATYRECVVATECPYGMSFFVCFHRFTPQNTVNP